MDAISFVAASSRLEICLTGVMIPVTAMLYGSKYSHSPLKHCGQFV